MKLHPSRDGRDFINIYSRSESILGRFLSNFHVCHMEIEGLGTIASIESYWYYLKTGEKYPELLMMKPYDVKKKGREIIERENPQPPADFVVKIYQALKAKIHHNKQMLSLLTRCPFPLVHFYWYGDPYKENVKIIDKTEDDLTTQLWIRIREELQGKHDE